MMNAITYLRRKDQIETVDKTEAVSCIFSAFGKARLPSVVQHWFLYILWC